MNLSKVGASNATMFFPKQSLITMMFSAANMQANGRELSGTLAADDAARSATIPLSGTKPERREGSRSNKVFATSVTVFDYLI
jgi:hypothetical protein